MRAGAPRALLGVGGCRLAVLGGGVDQRSPRRRGNPAIGAGFSISPARSIPQNLSVPSRVGCAVAGATRRVEHDALTAGARSERWVPGDAVTALLQGARDIQLEAGFERNRVGVFIVIPARRIHRGLPVHPMVDHIGQDLKVCLSLKMAAR